MAAQDSVDLLFCSLVLFPYNFSSFNSSPFLFQFVSRFVTERSYAYVRREANRKTLLIGDLTTPNSAIMLAY